MKTAIRNDWTIDEIYNIYNTPLLELIYEAATFIELITILPKYRFAHYLVLKPVVAAKIVLIARRLHATILVLMCRH